jgi:hypothetical protein
MGKPVEVRVLSRAVILALEEFSITDLQLLDASRESVAISRRISFSLPSGPSSAPKASFDRQE